MRLFLITLFFFIVLDAHALCVSADLANLRGGPGKKYKLTWTVGKYMPLLKVGYKKGWYRVKDIDGAVHWVHQSLVSKRFKCVAVKSKKVNLRTGPGTKFSYAAYQSADRYFPFKKINHRNEWLQLIDASGNKVWAHENTLWRARKVSNISF